jgi:putative restriction endonuclease
MRLFVGVTDWNWWSLHAGKPFVEEVNFWRPSPAASFQALNAGEMFLFKLHSPRNAIAGGGFFTKFLSLPVSLAWEAFGEGNGARSLAEVRKRIGFYRRAPIEATEDPNIGCILLEEPFFFAEPELDSNAFRFQPKYRQWQRIRDLGRSGTLAMAAGR